MCLSARARVLKKLFLIPILLLIAPISWAQQLASDNFNRANQNPIGTPWLTVLGTHPQILNNQFTGNPADTPSLGSAAVYDGGIAWPTSQYSQATIVALNPGKGFAGLELDRSATDAYQLGIDTGGTAGGLGQASTVLFLRSSAAHTLASFSIVPQSGDVLRAQVVCTSVCTLAFFQNGNLIGSFTDPGSVIPNGKPGMDASLVAGASASDVVWDNWSGGVPPATGGIVLASDNFNRANQNPIGAPWSNFLGNGQIINNALSPAVATANVSAAAIYTGIAWPNDQFSQASLTQLVATEGYAAIVLRHTAGGDFYYCGFDASPGFGGMGIRSTGHIWRYVGGVVTSLAAGIAIPSVGDTFRCQIIGSTVSFFQNGNQLFSATDASPIIAGSPGLFVQSAGTLANVTDITWDNWQGGTLGAASNGYGFRRAITISHTQVPNTDQINFPVLISGTYPYLATVANSGNVTNANGFDIIFTSDAAGENPLPFERESYSATTGQVNFWVQVPTLSHTVDTVIYMFYGNPSVTTDPSNRTQVWDSNFVAVYHMGDNAATTTVLDSTSNAENGTAAANTSTKTGSGKIDGALNFDGKTDFITVPQNGKFNFHASPFTLSGWMMENTPVSLLKTAQHKAFSWYDGTKNMQLGFCDAAGDVNKCAYMAVGTSTAAVTGVSTGNVTAASYHHVVGTFDGASTIHIYVDGANVDGGTADKVAGTYSADSTTLYIGQRGDGRDHFNGQLDELRISKSVRSADWIATEYNNESNPATFYSIGSGSTPLGVTRLSPASGPVNTSVTITGENFGGTQGTSTVTFNGTPGTATSWSTTTIITTVPNGATTGPVTVTVGSQTSNGVTFTVTSAAGGPNITSVTPTSAAVGAQVTITGSGFGTTQGSGLVWLGTRPGNVVSWSDTQIVATVAPGAKTGNARVLQNNALSNSVPFTVSGSCP
jgi:hypothetical protein